ncbi:hypothetical protein L1887_51318 [Cichorium endivia]|nr:hypothetical protein L1887_51318 [Cichorium endivia]
MSRLKVSPSSPPPRALSNPHTLAQQERKAAQTRFTKSSILICPSTIDACLRRGGVGAVVGESCRVTRPRGEGTLGARSAKHGEAEDEDDEQRAAVEAGADNIVELLEPLGIAGAQDCLRHDTHCDRRQDDAVLSGGHPGRVQEHAAMPISTAMGMMKYGVPGPYMYLAIDQVTALTLSDW